MPYMLGRLAKREDRRTLQLANYLRVPMPPASKDYAHGITDWGTMLNTKLGCCTISAIGHGLQTDSANASTEITVPDSAILTAYVAVSGYDPRTGANDIGANELDVLRYWQQTGVAGRKAVAYAECSIANLDDVRACIDLFGFCYIGFNVPQSAMQQFENGQPWDVVAADGGIIGGHAVVLKGYTPTTFDATTWGANQTMTVAFFKRYVEEAYGVVLPEWIAANGESPSGLNLQQLLADVQQLQQAPDPAPPPAAKTLADYDGSLKSVIGDTRYDLNAPQLRAYLAAWIAWIEQATAMLPAYQAAPPTLTLFGGEGR